MIYHAKASSHETRCALLVAFQEDVKSSGFAVAESIFTMKEHEHHGQLQYLSKE